MHVYRRKMKAIAPLVCFLLIMLCVAGCTPPQGEGFAIYLLAQDIPASRIAVMSHVDLAERPLISVRDVLSYSRDTHEIELTAEAYGRVTNLEVPVSGKVFAVCIDHHPVYCGAFWTPISSMSFNGITIMKPLAQYTTSDKHLIQIQIGYPSPEFFTGDDPRAGPKILKSLKQARKLK